MAVQGSHFVWSNVQFARSSGRSVDRVASAALASELSKITMGILQSRRLVLYEAFARILKTGWISSVICMKWLRYM